MELWRLGGGLGWSPWMCGLAEPPRHRLAVGPTGALSPAVYPGHPGLKITRAAQPGRT